MKKVYDNPTFEDNLELRPYLIQWAGYCEREFACSICSNCGFSMLLHNRYHNNGCPSSFSYRYMVFGTECVVQTYPKINYRRNQFFKEDPQRSIAFAAYLRLKGAKFRQEDAGVS